MAPVFWKLKASNTHSLTRPHFWYFSNSSINCRPNIQINEPLGNTLIQTMIFFYFFLSLWKILWHSSVAHGPSAVCWALSISRDIGDWQSKFWGVHILFMPSTAYDWCTPLPCPHIIHYLYHHLITRTCWMYVLCTFMINLLGVPIQILLKYGLGRLSY